MRFSKEPEVKIVEDLTYIEQLVQTADTQVRKCGNKEIPMVKVPWNHLNMKSAPGRPGVHTPVVPCFFLD